MVLINLLPWRVNKKLYERKTLIKILLCTITLTIMLLIGAFYFLNQLEIQNQIDLLQLNEEEQKIANVTVSTKKKEFVSEVNEGLQELIKNRTLLHALLNQLVKMQTHRLCFSEIKQDKNAVIFIGHVASAIDFTDLIINWPVAKLFYEIKLNTLKKSVNDTLDFNFIGSR